MLISTKLKPLLNKAAIKPLDSRLYALADAGFTLVDNKFYILKAYKNNTPYSQELFFDEIGYEVFYNSIRIEDYVNLHFLEQLLSFIFEIFTKWNSKHKKEVLVANISVSEESHIVKFHMKRGGETWLSSDVNSYPEAVGIMFSTELPKFKRWGATIA